MRGLPAGGPLSPADQSPAMPTKISLVSGKLGFRESGMRFIWKLAGVGFAVFLLLQLVRPALTNPPVTADLQAPPEVKAILKKSCYSCHSNETALPWFDRVVAGYWVAVHDVKAARAKLNFSEIGKLPVPAQRAALYEAVNMVQFGAMPLPRYLHVHPGSAVTPEELQVLRGYLDPFAA